jgi:hypothetical protein
MDVAQKLLPSILFFTKLLLVDLTMLACSFNLKHVEHNTLAFYKIASMEHNTLKNVNIWRKYQN